MARTSDLRSKGHKFKKTL